MQQVEDGITLLAVLVAGGCINRQAAVHAQRGTIVPHTSHCSVRHFVHLVEVGTVTADDEHIRHSCHITNHIDVAGIHYFQPVHKESIAIKFGFQRFGSGIFPHAVLALLHIDDARSVILAPRCLDGVRRQEVTRQLHLHGFRRLQAESDRIVIVNLRRNYRSTAPQGLLRKAHCTHQQQSK